TLSKDEILKGAHKEGKLVFATAHEETTVPHLINAFKKRHPFIKEIQFHSVSGIPAGQKELFDLAAGKSNVDAFTPHSVFGSEYLKQDFSPQWGVGERDKARQLNMRVKMVAGPNVVLWTTTTSDIIV